MAAKSPQFVDAEAVENNMDLGKLITALEGGFASFSGGPNSGVVQPVRSAVEVKEHNGVLLTMPAYSAKDNALATKLVTLYSDNAKLGIPSHQGIVISFDPKTGTPVAFLDSESITNLRTAAATAVATKHLATSDAKILAIVGSGHQAHSHVKLLKLVRNFSEIRVWSRNIENANKFAEEVNGKAFQTIEETVKDADVIVTVTLSREPVLLGKWVKENCLVNIVGACRPDWREVDDDVMLSSQVIVDTREGALKESGDVILSKATILGELGDVISKSVSIDFAKRRVFKSLGMALEDALAAKIVLENMQKKE